MQINSQTNGIRELLQAFEKSPEVFTRHVKLALNQNLRDVQVEAKQNHRFISRHNANGLENAIKTQDADNNLSGKVYIDPGCKHGKWIHEGTGLYGYKGERYPITPTNRGSLRWATGNGFKFAKKIMHPGVRPDQFLYKALRNKESSIQQRYMDAVTKARTEVGL